TIPESARHYIDEELRAGKTLAEMHADQLEYQHQILAMQLRAEQSAPRDRVTFLDRGIPDSLAYYRYNKLAEDAMITDAVAACSYKKIFLLDLLPITDDYAREESAAAQESIQGRLIEV